MVKYFDRTGTSGDSSNILGAVISESVVLTLVLLSLAGLLNVALIFCSPRFHAYSLSTCVQPLTYVLQLAKKFKKYCTQATQVTVYDIVHVYIMIMQKYFWINQGSRNKHVSFIHWSLFALPLSFKCGVV